jgi:Cdc6-like AAA superfamily ATPase
MSGDESNEAMSLAQTSLPPLESATTTSALVNAATPSQASVQGAPTILHPSSDNNHDTAETNEESIKTETLPQVNGDEDNDDEDDDLSSTISSSSSSTNASADADATASWQALDYAERRAQRIARNEAYLTSLGLMKGQPSKSILPSRRKQTGVSTDGNDTDQNQSHQGILISATDTTPPTKSMTVHDLYQAFPGRTTEIRSLYANLSYALQSHRDKNGNNDDDGHATIPTPLWVTGAPGTGKTDIIQAILKRLVPTSFTNDTMATAIVIHCHAAQIPPPLTVEGVVAFLYQELWKQLGLAGDDTVATQSKKRKKQRQLHNDNNARRPRTALRRRATTAATQKTSQTARRTAADMAESTTITKSNKTYTAIWTLGRLWKSLTGNRPSVLVLDHVWMTMRPESINPLAQFLLLPQHLQLNLTIVVVTQNALLDQTRKSIQNNIVLNLLPRILPLIMESHEYCAHSFSLLCCTARSLVSRG